MVPTVTVRSLTGTSWNPPPTDGLVLLSSLLSEPTATPAWTVSQSVKE